jgi:hypothetical protein
MKGHRDEAEIEIERKERETEGDRKKQTNRR